MKNKQIIFGIILIAVIIIFVVWTGRSKAPSVALDYKNIGYEIDGRQINLVNGYSEVEVIVGSASKIKTNYFGNEVGGDFNNDGMEDVAFLLTQDGGGSGTFFYVVAALKTSNGYKGLNAILLGDRIAPQTTEFRDGKIIVNYADRKPGEPMTAQPTVGVSRYFQVQGDKLIEVSL